MASKRKNVKKLCKIFGKLIFMASLLFVMLFALYISLLTVAKDSDEILIVTSSEAETASMMTILVKIFKVLMPQVSGHTP